VGSKDTEDICLNTGHIGIYVSSKCQAELAPKIFSWLKARDKHPTRGRKKAAAGAGAAKPKTSTKKRTAETSSRRR
jgi:polyhydroxyalkanoate synthase